MAHNFQLVATFSHPRRSISMPKLPDWANPPLPNRGEPHVVVESKNTNVMSTINVEHAKTMVLMGKICGKPKKADVIHMELALSWIEGVKNIVFVDHFDRNWFALEFTDEDEVGYLLEMRHSYMRGQIFHLERWMEDFKESNPIAYLRVWVQIPRIPMQFKEVEIMKNITQSIDRLIRLDVTSINSLNVMAIRVVIDVDIRLPLKRVLVINGDEKLPTFINYQNLFTVCSYCERRTIENYGCDEEDKD